MALIILIFILQFHLYLFANAQTLCSNLELYQI